MNGPKVLHKTTLFGKDYQWVRDEDGVLRLTADPKPEWVSIGFTTDRDRGLVYLRPREVAGL